MRNAWLQKKGSEQIDLALELSSVEPLDVVEEFLCLSAAPIYSCRGDRSINLAYGLR